jgi:hypothetical protein
LLTLTLGLGFSSFGMAFDVLDYHTSDILVRGGLDSF